MNRTTSPVATDPSRFGPVILSSVTDLMNEIRIACARVAQRAQRVSIELEAIPAYAQALEIGHDAQAYDSETHPTSATREQLAAFWLCLDAINFGSGWFPTLRKREGRSGYFTIALGVRERFVSRGPWSAEELAAIGTPEIAEALLQDREHELMALFALSLRDLGSHVSDDFEGRFAGVVDAARGSAAQLATLLGGWESFADTSSYADFSVPFFKRAQLAAADLNRAGVASFSDQHRLTMFADNLVPHVLRLDRVLRFDPQLVARIDRGQLIEHGSPEEVEIRACALQAVELIVAAAPQSCAAEIDYALWNRGRQPRYKASPRHRSRCTAY